MPRLDEVIAYLRPDKEWTLIGEDIADLQFTDSSVDPITQTEYDAAESELQIAQDEALAAKAAAASSAVAKLEAIGLTAEEIAALRG